MTTREKYYGGILSETTSYSWDDRGLLVQVVLPSGEPVRYTYDGAGRLIGRKDADGEQSFVQSGWDIVQETDEVSKQTTYYTGASALRDDGSLATGSRALYYHYDHLGNTRLVTDEKGEVVSRFHYEAYGTTVDAEGRETDGINLTSQPYLYVGKYGIRYDSKTEMHYMRYRWYDNSTLRFLSDDLLESINRYEYVSGNPINQIDIFGLQQLPYFQDPRYQMEQEINAYLAIHTKKMSQEEKEEAFISIANLILPPQFGFAKLPEDHIATISYYSLYAGNHGHHPVPYYLVGSAKGQDLYFAEDIGHMNLHKYYDYVVLQRQMPKMQKLSCVQGSENITKILRRLLVVTAVYDKVHKTNYLEHLIKNLENPASLRIVLDPDHEILLKKRIQAAKRYNEKWSLKKSTGLTDDFWRESKKYFEDTKKNPIGKLKNLPPVK